jgi:hypothetical protein
MEAGRRRGRGRMSRTRIRTPANLRNRAAPPREDDTTIALLRQQQQIMAQMVEQQQRMNTVIELLATRLVPLRHLRWRFDRRRRPHQDRRYPILSCHHEHRTGKPSRGLALNCTGDGHQRSGSCRTTPNFRRFGHGEPSRILGGV